METLAHSESHALETSDNDDQREVLRRDDSNKVLTFLLANEEYAIDILAIEEITRPLTITYVPRVPPYIMGVVSLRGRVIPILDLHARLGLSAFSPGKKNRFIIFQVEQSGVGIIADRINDVVTLSKHQLQPAPAKIKASGSGFIKNIGRVGERMLIILDIEKVLQIHREHVSV